MSHFKANPKLSKADSVLISSLKSLKNFDDVASMLEITPKHLHYILFKKKLPQYYTFFNISKKAGGSREIWAPQKSLKILQEKLNRIFTLAYKPSIVAHGFIKDRDILTNANKHLRKKYVLNFDLEDFFLNINFGRVRGVLISFFGMSENAATIIANICCYNNVLPQGAPTSPILSNMICFKLDSQMKNLAKQYDCDYTRYADDLTISTTRNTFPKAIGYIDDDNVVHLGSKLLEIIGNNGFKVKDSKSRLHNRFQNLSVTGITVNKITNVERNYVKKTRAILRCLETNPSSVAQKLFESKYYSNSDLKKCSDIMKVVKGMISYIGYVKGKQDPIYEKLALRYNRIARKNILKVGEAFHKEWSKYVWVIEIGYFQDDGCFFPEKQGTGFFLNNVGFVTNEHVVRDHVELPDLYHIQVHRSRYGKECFYASIRRIDKDRDIAILDIDGFNTIGFDFDLHNHSGQNIKVIGYPNFGDGDSLYAAPGVITQYRSEYMPNTYNKETGKLGVRQERIVISARIVSGNSGGPVINANGQVVGIATKGFSTVSELSRDEDSTAENYVVQISDVFEILYEKDQKLDNLLIVSGT